MLTKDEKKMQKEACAFFKGKTQQEILEAFMRGSAARRERMAKVKIKYVCLVHGEKKGIYDVAAVGVDEKLYDRDVFDDYDYAISWAEQLCEEYQTDDDEPIELIAEEPA
jgi:hypothetical protein